MNTLSPGIPCLKSPRCPAGKLTLQSQGQSLGTAGNTKLQHLIWSIWQKYPLFFSQTAVKKRKTSQNCTHSFPLTSMADMHAHSYGISWREWKENAGCGIPRQLRDIHSIITQKPVSFLGPGLTHAFQLRLYELHKCVAFAYKEPSARLWTH